MKASGEPLRDGISPHATMETPEESCASRRGMAVLRELTLAGLGIALTSAVLAFGSAAGEVPSLMCSSFPACLGHPSVWVSVLHPLLGVLLFGVALTVAALAYGLRRELGRAWLGAMATPVLVVVMGTLGAAFATGRLGPGWLPLQDGFLALLFALLGWVFVASVRTRARDAAARRGNVGTGGATEQL